jgi:nickel/cobalt transporter (NicO) family protein
MLASPLLLGLFLGVRHAVDADHVATIASVVVGRTHLLGALRTALLWGLGHTLTFFGTGLAIVLFGLQVPARFELIVDVLIAISLLVLGGAQLAKAFRDNQTEQTPHASRPLMLGSLHGLAGSAAVALLALASIRSRAEALFYLALFGVGTIVGMLMITSVMAWSFQLSSSVKGARRGLILTAGLASCLCGMSILHELATEKPSATEGVAARA